jgi:hypothetical protein
MFSSYRIPILQLKQLQWWFKVKFKTLEISISTESTWMTSCQEDTSTTRSLKNWILMTYLIYNHSPSSSKWLEVMPISSYQPLIKTPLLKPLNTHQEQAWTTIKLLLRGLKEKISLRMSTLVSLLLPMLNMNYPSIRLTCHHSMLNLKKLSESLRTLNNTRLFMMNMVLLSYTNTILGGLAKRTGPLASSPTPLSTRSLTTLIGISTPNISRPLYMMSMILSLFTDLILTIITMVASTSELDPISN